MLLLLLQLGFAQSMPADWPVETEEEDCREAAGKEPQPRAKGARMER